MRIHLKLNSGYRKVSAVPPTVLPERKDSDYLRQLDLTVSAGSAVDRVDSGSHSHDQVNT